MQRSSCRMAKAAVSVVSRIVPVPAPPAGEYAAVREKLSFLDAPWVATPPLQQVYLYELAGGGGGHEFPVLVRRLKESLAATLALYLPLAGKLAYAAETGDVVVDCSDAGVDFFEAEAEGADVRRLAGDGGDDGARDVPAFLSLVPEHDARVLPAAVLRVQVTRLGVGEEGARAAGLAIGVSLHHAVADGLAIALFVGAWASACRGCSPVLPRPLGPPEHGRNAVAHAHPRGQDLARAVLNKVAPNLPVANEMEDYLSHRARLARRAFTLGADHVRSLKRRINELASRASATAGGGGKQPRRTKPVSTFVAVSALCWTAFVRANGLAAGADAHLVFQVDLRARLRPPVAARYSGNCVRGCLASADAGELVDGEAGLLHASRAIRAAVAEVEAAPVAGMVSWVERAMRLPPSRVACVAGGPVFRVYETNDFGFGRPGCVEPVSMAGSPLLRKNDADDYSVNGGEGTIVLYAGKGDGEVYVSVSLDTTRVDAFKAHIISDGVRPRI